MRTGLKTAIISLYRDLAMRTGFTARTIFTVYDYMFDPEQLRFLMDCIEQTARVDGCCLEAGCAKGSTTAFLKKWMDILGIQKNYIAIDTFSGFVNRHVEHEVMSRGKPNTISSPFSLNKRSWFDYSMKLANVGGVNSIQADIAEFNFEDISPISFCLLDVDLYLPIKKCLPNIYRNMSIGGIIVVDDCMPNNIYDGALQAYQEFMQSSGAIPRIECRKLGIIKKI
jgi:hypothetical protein